MDWFLFGFCFEPTVVDFSQTLSYKRVNLIKGSALEVDWVVSWFGLAVRR